MRRLPIMAFLVLAALPAAAQPVESFLTTQQAQRAFQQGYDYERGRDVAKDYARAMENYRLAAPGNPEARFRIGYLYEKGWGVAQDYAQAREWYLKAPGSEAAAARLARLPAAP